jgi:hypothetical protein
VTEKCGSRYQVNIRVSNMRVATVCRKLCGAVCANRINDAQDTVSLGVVADISALHSSVVSEVIVDETGIE